MVQKTDKQLVVNYLKGNDESLEVLIKKYIRPIYGFVYSFIGDPYCRPEAEDITQDIFVKVWRNLKKFNTKKSFHTWIFSIAKNTAIDWQKAKKTIPFSAFENAEGRNMFLENIVDNNPLPDLVFEKAAVVQNVQLAINKLTPKYQEVLDCYYNDDLNFREISQKTGQPLNTIKSRHRRALSLLKNFLPDP